MNLEPVDGIPGAVLGTPRVYGDSRGSFMEIFREDLLGVAFVQANHSRSSKGVLRGLHYHRKQADAWYVIAGEAQAMLADLRTPTEVPVVRSVDLVAGHPQVLYSAARVGCHQQAGGIPGLHRRLGDGVRRQVVLEGAHHERLRG